MSPHRIRIVLVFFSIVLQSLFNVPLVLFLIDCILLYTIYSDFAIGKNEKSAHAYFTASKMKHIGFLKDKSGDSLPPNGAVDELTPDDLLKWVNLQAAL